MKVKLRPYGADALLAQPKQRAAVLPLAAALANEPTVAEAVPAARTLLVRRAPGAKLAAVKALVRSVADGLTVAQAPSGPAVALDVHYDGPDLADVAAEVGLDADGFVRAHADGDYTVAFCGFAPGFAYLSGLAQRLQVPRLAQPRTRVPAGSVGVAGEFTGVYPRPSPGGWRLLGHTDAPLWELSRDPPALLPPGTRVRF
ncbi:MAG TPA: allophanate hydrolase subunit 1, partial [Jatrophihabitans sp.]|nr:allophanate hydrolase subunit 1 [Jatrophihabitans sp.]